MGILATPSRGQPLDVDYIGQIATQVNQLTTLVGDRSTSYSNIAGTSVKTSEVKMFGTTVSVVSQSTKTDGDFVDIKVSYPQFQNTPVVTGTIWADGSVGDDSTVVLKSVSPSEAMFRITFKTTGAFSVKLNVIAIGFSN